MDRTGYIAEVSDWPGPSTELMSAMCDRTLPVDVSWKLDSSIPLGTMICSVSRILWFVLLSFLIVLSALTTLAVDHSVSRLSRYCFIHVLISRRALQARRAYTTGYFTSYLLVRALFVGLKISRRTTSIDQDDSC
jgi:hypothetical protein